MPFIAPATAPPPEEVLPPPDPALAAPPPVLDTPPQQSAPQQSATQAPPPVLDTPPQTAQPQAQPQQAAPVSTGVATDAIGATTAQIPGAITAAPSTVGALKDAAPAAVTEFVAGQQARDYQPAPEGVEGAGGAAYQRQKTEAEAGLKAALQQGPSNIGNILGGVKDVIVPQLAMQQGNPLPWGSLTRQEMIESAMATKKTGVPLPEGYSNNALTRELVMSDDPGFERAFDEGWTNPDGYVYAPGWEAVWEYSQSGRSGVEQAALDVATDPIGTAADVAATVLTAGGSKLATEAAEQAVRFGAKTAGKQFAGKTMQVGGRVVDAAATLGLSEAVPGAFKVMKAGYENIPGLRTLARPTLGATQQAEAEAAQELGTSVTSRRADAAGQPGVATPAAPSQIIRVAPNVQRVAIPGDTTNPPIDVTYHTKVKNGQEKLVGVYDTALPGPTDRYRPLTEADAQALYDAWGRLGDADRKALRQSAYPQMSRLETSPGEPFIESAAERVFDDRGRLLADTGRVGAGYQREVDDLRRTILRDGRPDQIVTDFTGSWQGTLFDGKVHPLTRRTLAEHRLQTLTDVLDALPASYRTPEVQRHMRQMRAMLPPDAPSLIGTGQRWRGVLQGPGGGFIPITAREQQWLREMATVPVDGFKRKSLDAGRVGNKANLNLIFDRQPDPKAPPAFHNGYTTYLDLMDFRVKNPASGRRELAALQSEINGLRLSPRSQSREDAIRDVLTRTGIVPNAATLNTDGLVIEIENYLRLNRPTFPPLPGAVAGPPAGTFPAGSQDELWGIHWDDATRDALDHQIDIGGTSRTLGQRLFTHWEETATAYELAKRQGQGIPLSSADGKVLNKQVARLAKLSPQYKNLTAPKLAALEPAEVDRLSTALLKSDIETSQGVRSASGVKLTPAEMKGLIGKGLMPYDKAIALWRSTVLYNVARGVTYPVMQQTGNTLSAVVSGNYRAALMYQNPMEMLRAFRHLRDVEAATPPRAVFIRDKVGLGRSKELSGRISRDQIGSKTAYNEETSHPVTKALGVVFGNQRIKDLADSRDMGFRQTLYTAAIEPSYHRLKRDLTPMTMYHARQIAAARGVPITVSPDQIKATIKNLEAASDGYFSQPQLQQALFEAMGGNAAANRNEVLGVARNTAAAYHKELTKLDDLAIAEVKRVAFDGGETNAQAVLQRMFMFTWWLGNATRLYAIEAAKSPIQMGIWSRAIEAGQQQEREGGNPAFKFFTEFMKTPAGYTVSFNQMALAGTYLFGNATDPADERSVLTAYGELMSGHVGDNLILSPMLQGLAQVIGAGGQDFRTPDVFATGRIEREITDALNLANQHLIQFSSTNAGNPKLIPYPGVSQGVINRLAQVFSGLLPGTQQVAGFDPSAGQEAQIAALVSEQMVAQNPDLDPHDPADAAVLENGVNQVMSDHDNPLYQAALDTYVGSLYAGTGSTGEGGWRDVLGAVTSHWVLPTQFSRVPTFRAEGRERIGRDKLRDAGASTLTPEAEASEFDTSVGRLGQLTPEGRELELIRDQAAGDPQTQQVRDIANGIRFGNLSEVMPSIRVGNYDFTAEQIAALPEEDRNAIANAWLDTTPGMRAVMDAYYENYRAQLSADKAFADAEGLDDYAKQYPGGIDRFVDDTAQVNPNYKAFIEGEVVIGGKPVSLPELRVTDHDEWVKQVTIYNEARTVIAGVKDSRYGLEIDPKYAGVVAGLDTPVGAWMIAEQEARAAGTDSEFTTALRDSYEKFTDIAGAMDSLDQQWGRPVGTTRALFVQGTLAGGLDSATDKEFALPFAEHEALQAMGVSDYFESGWQMKAYFDWQLQQPAGADTSIESYNRAYATKQNTARVQELALLLATGQAPVVGPDGQAVPPDPLADLVLSNGAVQPGVRAGQSSFAQPTLVASEPGGTQGSQAMAGMPVHTGEMVNGSDGSTWVHVTNTVLDGWVNVNSLSSTGTAPAPTAAPPTATPEAAPVPTPTTTAPAAPSRPWYEQAAGAVGSVFSGVSNAVGGAIAQLGKSGPAPGPKTASGDPGAKPNQAPANDTTPPPPTTAPGAVPAAEPADPFAGQYTPGYFDVVPAGDGMGVQSTSKADRMWMEAMLADGATVTTEFKESVESWGPEWQNTYNYQLGHGAAGNNHAAYDLQCDKGPGMACWGSPISSPVSGTVVCGGYGQGQGALSSCTYSQGTTQAAPDGSAPAHTITVETGTDPDGNAIQLVFNHMATSEVTPGQTISVGDMLGGMGGNMDMAHLHLEAQAWCPSLGTYVILDPGLVVHGYYAKNRVC